jgi:hypothetical protein
MLWECLDLMRPKKQHEVEACIIRILSISTFSADRVAVDHSAEVSETLSAYIFGFSM